MYVQYYEGEYTTHCHNNINGKKKEEKKHVLIGVNVIRREIIQRCHFKGL